MKIIDNSGNIYTVHYETNEGRIEKMTVKDTDSYCAQMTVILATHCKQIVKVEVK